MLKVSPNCGSFEKLQVHMGWSTTDLPSQSILWKQLDVA